MSSLLYRPQITLMDRTLLAHDHRWKRVPRRQQSGALQLADGSVALTSYFKNLNAIQAKAESF